MLYMVVTCSYTFNKSLFTNRMDFDTYLGYC